MRPERSSAGALAEGVTRGLAEHASPHTRPPRAVTLSQLGRADALVAAGDCPVAGASGTAVPVVLYGQHAVVGPFPGADDPRRPCARCLVRRWQSVRSTALRDALEAGGATSAVGDPPYATAFITDTVAALIAAHQESARGAVDTVTPFPTVYLIDLETLSVRSHSLALDPECTACGIRTPDSPEQARVTLRPAPKHAPGAFRVRALDDYDLPVDAFANPVCGALGPAVLSDLTSVTTAATMGAFTTRSGSYLRETLWGGHGDTYSDSIRIGVLEGLERSAGIRARGRTTQVVAPLASLADRALDPRTCGLYSDEFYAAHPEVTPFDVDREISWVWGHSLRDDRRLLVPEILAYYHVPGLQDRFVQETSNGSASGGSLEEAILFGLMEVVERDAFLLTWYGKAPLREIDPQTSARGRTRQMVDRLAMYGYTARLFDARISFPLPIVIAAAQRTTPGLGSLCFGAGASLDPEAAAGAALCEIATDAVNLPGRTRRDEERLRALAANFDHVLGLHDHPLMYGIPNMAKYADFLLGEPGTTRAALAAFADRYQGLAPPSPDITQDLNRCLAWVTGAGFDVVVVDQTLPAQRHVGLFTVKVLVPGMIPIDFGWQRQRALNMPRLRTALRDGGLHARELQPADFNPAPHPFP